MSRQRKTNPDLPFDAADAPIQTLDEDRLGRRPFAHALAAEIMAAPAARGYVMGLTGAWGSGKTSILNMTTDAIGESATVVHFNPWMFSGTESLVGSFFSEISKQLEKKGVKLKKIAGKLAVYGQVLSPFAALAGAAGATQGALNVLQSLAAQPSVIEQRQELRSLLAGLGKRLIVVIDDVDRLRPEEVRDIVRLVRLVGDFPNTLYLLAFDRTRVEECLGEDDLPRGRAYLEKIVQVTHDVPAARQPDVAEMFTAGLAAVAEDVPTGPLRTEDFHNIFVFIVRPLLVTPRHVQRLLGSLSMTMRMVGDEVALADLVGIEAVRVLHPALFAAVTSVAEDLAARPDLLGRGGYQPGRAIEDSPIAPLHAAAPELAQPMCRWLFPAARRYFENTGHGTEWEHTWRSQRKIASAAVFRFYLERQLPDGVVPAGAVDDALAKLTDPDGLRRTLEHWSPEELADLIERMNTTIETLPVTEEIDADPALLATPVLLDMLPRLPEDRGGFAFTGSMILRRAALRLLRRLPDEEIRGDVVRAVFAETSALSARRALLWTVGHREQTGTGLVTASTVAQLEEVLRSELASLPPGVLAGQDRIASLASLMAENGEGRSALQRAAEDDGLMLALLTDCVGATRGQELGAAAVTVKRTLPWEELTGWFGEAMLLRRICEIAAVVAEGAAELPEEQRAALCLAENYAAGNRPQRPWERMVRQNPGAGDGKGPPAAETGSDDA